MQELLGHAVETFGQFAQLIGAGHGHGRVQVAFGHFLRGLGEGRDDLQGSSEQDDEESASEQEREHAGSHGLAHQFAESLLKRIPIQKDSDRADR